MNILACFFILLSNLTLAAPHPATSSSFLLGVDSGRYFSKHGFKVSLGQSGWTQSKPPKAFESIEALYFGPDRSNGFSKPSLTVRRDPLRKKMNLEQYVKKWQKDYHRFGFDIINSQKVKVGSNIGHMLDLTHSETEHQLRQVVFVKNKNAVIFTCRDQKDLFLASLKSCNEIIRTFRWTL